MTPTAAERAEERTVTSGDGEPDTGGSDEQARRVSALIDELLDEFDPATTDPIELRGAQYDRGLAWVHYPDGFGGLGFRASLQRDVDRRLRAAGFPGPTSGRFFGLFLAGPTIVTHGSDEIRHRLLRPLFTGEHVWCQLFSEPGAGSDLASLSTRAVRDGDEWVVNGQKVWNTLAHLGDRGMLVARTDPDVPKHRGLTYFALDMHSPGVDVRALRQITGEAEFNEVYLTDVRIPDADRIGEVGDGWRVSMTTLMNERVTIGGGGGSGDSGGPKRGSGAIAEAVDLWHRRTEHDPVVLDRLMKLWIDEEALRLTNMRAAANAKSGNPGPEGSIAKLALALNQQRIYELCMNLLGAEALIGFDYTFRRPDEIHLTAALGEARHMFLRARANSIEGGTSEIMRNILGERILGLPGEPRVDKELPWSKVPRS
jgi:alkylation response protein AidB-like acyl-CoA dehydrogenase